MGLFGNLINSAKSGINAAKQRTEDAYYDGMNYYNDMCSTSLERDMCCLERCIEQFEKYRSKDMSTANGYLMAAKKIVKNKDTISDPTIINQYEKCKSYGWNYAKKLIVEPEMLSRGLAEKDDSGRIIPIY